MNSRRVISTTTAAPAGEVERLRALVEDGIETLESMNLHDTPLYERLRAGLEQSHPKQDAKNG